MQVEGDIPCPRCGRKFKQRIADMREGRSRRCPHCGVEMRLTGDGGPQAQKAIDDLTRKLANMKFNIKFKL